MQHSSSIKLHCSVPERPAATMHSSYMLLEIESKFTLGVCVVSRVYVSIRKHYLEVDSVEPTPAASSAPLKEDGRTAVDGGQVDA
jgi:hypothetical protein